jgi:aminobenzoyl-glutamate utilization protein B
MSLDETALEYLDANQEQLGAIAKAIWDHPEVGLQEFFAAQRLSEELKGAGFRIEAGVGQMPTAFVATWGEGKPIIGILGEYDALPGLSQKVSPIKEPVEAGGPGHGCGHNLLGTASLGAALAVKEAMEKDGVSGTVRFYGCPAEETLVGKVFMARDGVFDDLDAAITWHSGYANTVWAGSSLAMNSFKVNFHGVASHAGAAPHMGRSALDGAQLMDIGVNYLREHVIPDARIHSVITYGGDAPNIVPPYAQIWYYVRAPHREQVEEIYARVLDIAQGAALMSGTTHDIDFLTGCYEMLPNGVIHNVMLEKMGALGGPGFSAEEMVFAKELQNAIPPEMIEMTITETLDMLGRGVTREDLGETLCEKIIPSPEAPKVQPGSTEVGDVSQITPTGNLTTCCEPLGTPPHSWQEVAASGSPVGLRGMMFAAKALALTALDLMTKPELLKTAREEFEKATEGKQYITPLSEGAKPR